MIGEHDLYFNHHFYLSPNSQTAYHVISYYLKEDPSVAFLNRERAGTKIREELWQKNDSLESTRINKTKKLHVLLFNILLGYKGNKTKDLHFMLFITQNIIEK